MFLYSFLGTGSCWLERLLELPREWLTNGRFSCYFPYYSVSFPFVRPCLPSSPSLHLFTSPHPTFPPLTHLVLIFSFTFFFFSPPSLLPLLILFALPPRPQILKLIIVLLIYFLFLLNLLLYYLLAFFSLFSFRISLLFLPVSLHLLLISLPLFTTSLP